MPSIDKLYDDALKRCNADIDKAFEALECARDKALCNADINKAFKVMVCARDRALSELDREKKKNYTVCRECHNIVSQSHLKRNNLVLSRGFCGLECLAQEQARSRSPAPARSPTPAPAIDWDCKKCTATNDRRNLQATCCYMCKTPR